MAEYRGQTLILYFGGLWCVDCIVDGPFVNARGAATFLSAAQEIATEA